MILHFRADNTWSIVSGVEPEPEGVTDEQLAAKAKHNMRASKAFGDLLNCLGEKFVELAATFTEVSEAWHEIRTLCEVSTSQKVFALQQALEKFEFSKPATSCLVKLRTIFRELEQRGGTTSETQKSVKLLSILPPEYNELVKTIKTSETYQTTEEGNLQNSSLDFKKVYNSVYRRAILEEAEESQTSSTELALYSRTSNLPQRNASGRRQFTGACWECNERGHLARDCPNVRNKPGASSRRPSGGPQRPGGARGRSKSDFNRNSGTEEGRIGPEETANICLATVQQRELGRELELPPGLFQEESKTVGELWREKVLRECDLSDLRDPVVNFLGNNEKEKLSPELKSGGNEPGEDWEMNFSTPRRRREYLAEGGKLRELRAEAEAFTPAAQTAQFTRVKVNPDFERERSSTGTENYSRYSRSTSGPWKDVCLDSASTLHLCSEKELMFDVKPLERAVEIVTAAGNFVVRHKGKIRALTKSKGRTVTFDEVYYYPFGPYFHSRG